MFSLNATTPLSGDLGGIEITIIRKTLFQGCSDSFHLLAEVGRGALSASGSWHRFLNGFPALVSW